MRVLRFESGDFSYIDDEVVEDVLVSISVNDEQLSRMMAFDEHLEELVNGHLKTSDIIQSKNEIDSIEWDAYHAYVSLDEDFEPLAHSESWYGVLEQAFRGREVMLEGNDELVSLDPQQVFQVMRVLNDAGRVFKRTGGTHSALIYHEEKGSVFAEDVGRFNALDKAVGLAMAAGFDLSTSILATSGRLAGEMVLKAAYAGLPVMCSVSAPMYSGVRIAQAAGMSLLGFVRDERFNVYSGFRRISSQIS